MDAGVSGMLHLCSIFFIPMARSSHEINYMLSCVILPLSLKDAIFAVIKRQVIHIRPVTPKLQYVVQQPNHDSTNFHPQLISDSRSSDLFHPRRLFFIYKSDHFLYPVQRGSSRVAARMQQTPQPRLRIYDQSTLCRYCVSRVSTDRNSSFRVITAIFIPYNIPQMNCCLCSVDVAASYRRQPPSALSSAQG